MKTTIKFISLLLIVFLIASCERESNIISDFDGKAPFTPIEEGTTEASQLAYSIYKKHDLYVYYNLEGEEALETEYGSMRLPTLFEDEVIKADEERALIFLKLIDEMYDLFSDYRELSVYRRLVLAGNGFIDANTRQYDNFGFNRDFVYQNIQGAEIFGNVNNTFEFDLLLTKEMLLYSYFCGYVRYNFTVPQNFRNVSSGDYRFERVSSRKTTLFSSTLSAYDEEESTDVGFVHPYGTLAIAFNPYADWEAYVVWIISRPKAERDIWLNSKERIKTKYDIVIAKMLNDYGMDLEALSTQWQSVGSTL